MTEELEEVDDDLMRDIEDMISAGETKEDIYHQLIRGEEMSEEDANKYFNKALRKNK